MAPKLQSVRLDAWRFAGSQLDAAFKDLSFSSSLISLTIWSWEIDTQTVKKLSKAKSLTELEVYVSPTANEEIRTLATLPQLQTLTVIQDSYEVKAAIPTFASFLNMPSLTSLDFILRFEDHDSDKFVQLNPSSLTSLYLFDLGVSSDMFSRLAQSLHQLRKLSLSMFAVHENKLDYFESITSISTLARLSLSRAALSPAISRLSHLEDLRLHECALDCETSKAIASLPSLHSIRSDDYIDVDDGMYQPNLKSIDALLQSQSLVIAGLCLWQSDPPPSAISNTNLLDVYETPNDERITFEFIHRNRRLWYNWCCVTLLLASYRANRDSEIRDSILSLIGEIVENAVPTSLEGPIEMEVEHFRTF